MFEFRMLIDVVIAQTNKYKIFLRLNFVLIFFFFGEFQINIVNKINKLKYQ